MTDAPLPTVVDDTPPTPLRLRLLAGAVVTAWLAGVLLHIVRRRAIALWLRLRRPTHRVRVRRDLAIPMADGVTLAADHYAPQSRQPCPTLLIRTPYGRSARHGWFGLRVAFVARRFAERGYHVVAQDVRGRFDSGGDFEPYFHERDDGLATLDWLKQQPWFSGEMGMWGPSYLGVVQWAMADAPEVKALFPMITSSELYPVVFPDGAFDAGLILRWLLLLELGQRQRYRSLLWGALLLVDMEWRFRRASRLLPLSEAEAGTGIAPPPYYRQWLAHTSPDDPFWQETLRGTALADIQGQVHLLGGWYDFFLRGLLHDYAALKAAGKSPRLTIGPWYHFSHLFLMWNTLDHALPWFDTCLRGQSAPPTLPVRLYVMGADEWREYADYPPPAHIRRVYLAGGGQLVPAPEDSPPDEFDYDPAHPTPAWAGAQFALRAGAQDNRRLERRPDVLTYTTPVLTEPMDVIGPVRLELFVRSSLENTDFYGRVCVVEPNGRSINLCDGLTRITAGLAGGQDERLADGVWRVEVDLWATAYHFVPGQRLRVIVASGAHPRWNRHTGGDNPLTDVSLCPAHQWVYHDPAHPSAVFLPVVESLT